MNPAVFKKYKLSEEDLKAYWTGKGKNEKREKLRELLAARTYEGIHSGLKDHKTWWAVDLAYDVPFNQTTPTLVQNIISKKYENTSQLMDALKTSGLNVDEIIKEHVNEKGEKIQVIDVPVFFRVLVPLVKAYVTIRRAKLFNDRNLYPFMKYEPVRLTSESRMVSEIITDIVQQMATKFGYPSVLKQMILQALQYGICVAFPMEEWYCEKQIVDESGTEKCIKEGLRYHLPHPTRFAIDNNHRPSTINTDTGCEWGLYWRIDRYSNVMNNSKYWNTDSIPFSKELLPTMYPQYFREIYPCQMAFPNIANSGQGAGVSDRENAVRIYSQGHADNAITVTEHFDRIVPKDWDMGDYPFPIWMRFVVASDNAVLWCSPMAYHPMLFIGYDTDENRSRNSSMSLEILPYQDIIGNLLSQQLLSVKQNLSKAVFYDTDQVDSEYVKLVENQGQRRYNGIPMIPFSGRKARIAGQSVQQAFHPVTFPAHDVATIANTISQIISILERILVLSSQEIGQPASHEQTAEESRIIAGNTSTRVSFTGSFIDDAFDAWKRQIYAASRAYMDDEVVAQISVNQPDAEKVLKDLGFTIESKTEDKGPSHDPKTKAVVKAKMSKLDVDAFISTREGESRVNSPQIAGAMSQIIQAAISNPMTASAIGAKQALDLITQAGIIAGLPRDFKLDVSKEYTDQTNQQKELAQKNHDLQLKQMEAAGKQLENPPEQGGGQDIQKAAQAIQQGTLQEAMRQIGQPLAEQIKMTREEQFQMGQAVAKLIAGLNRLQSSYDQAAAPPTPPVNEPAPLV